MAAFRFALGAAFLLGFGLGGAHAQTSAAVAAGDPGTILVGPAMGDPEKDSVGLARVPAADCGLVPRFSNEVVSHGTATGDPEKDDVAFRVSGYDPCGDRGGGGGAPR